MKTTDYNILSLNNVWTHSYIFFVVVSLIFEHLRHWDEYFLDRGYFCPQFRTLKRPIMINQARFTGGIKTTRTQLTDIVQRGQKDLTAK